EPEGVDDLGEVAVDRDDPRRRRLGVVVRAAAAGEGEGGDDHRGEAPHEILAWWTSSTTSRRTSSREAAGAEKPSRTTAISSPVRGTYRQRRGSTWRIVAASTGARSARSQSRTPESAWSPSMWAAIPWRCGRTGSTSPAR